VLPGDLEPPRLPPVITSKYNGGMSKPSAEFACWKASLAMAFLVARIAPAFAPHLCEFFGVILQGVGFAVGGVFERFRDSFSHGADGERR